MDYNRRNTSSDSRRRTTRPADPYSRASAPTRRASTAPRRPANASSARRPAPAPARRAPANRAPARQQPAIRRLLVPILIVEVVLLILVLSRCNSNKAPANPASQPTAVPTATQTLTPTAEPVAEPTQFVPQVTKVPSFDDEPAQPQGQPQGQTQASSVTPMLPIYTEGNTTEKVIAITIDDCFQMANLDKILDYAVAYNGKVTVFPAGRVLSTDYSKQVLRRVYQLGFEIENHTYEHSRVYGVSDQEMASNIYRQNLAVNDALNLDYEMHFFRFFGGNGEPDPRVHQYLIKLGYKGVMDWTYSGSDATISQIKKHLAPGAIFLFHTTGSDLKKLKEFIPYAVSQGYKLVTLNELFGLEANRVGPRTTSLETTTIPAPDPYEYTVYQTLRNGDKSYLVQLVQERLAKLNYLASGDVDGDYGGKTVSAVRNFQSLAGLTADGVATIETQTRLFADDAPYNNTYALPTTAPAASEAPQETTDQPAFF